MGPMICAGLVIIIVMTENVQTELQFASVSFVNKKKSNRQECIKESYRKHMLMFLHHL